MLSMQCIEKEKCKNKYEYEWARRIPRSDHKGQLWQIALV